MRTALKRLILMRGGDGSASFLARPTGAATLTIAALTVSASTTVDWGDGSTDTYTGSGARTHNYAAAGSYRVRILQPGNVTALRLTTTGVPVVVNSAHLAPLVNVTDIRLQGISATLNTANFRSWLNVAQCRFASFLAGSSGTVNSADMSHWPLTSFGVWDLPVGMTGTFNTADAAAWNTADFYWHGMPAGYTITVTAGGFANMKNNVYFQMNNNGLSQSQVDQILADLYTAAQSRTASAGTILLSGTNAAPSGTYAAACPPTTGKEYAYELINDSCGVIDTGETWTTITVTGGL